MERFYKNCKSNIVRNPGLLTVLGLFALTVLLVNPLRETAMEDDWAYAWTVKNLLETGRYQLHDWLAPNMPFQAYWGVLFSRVLGFSHASLRVSTLALSFAGLIAFYLLAQEHGMNRTQSALLSLGLLASPLVLRFSFNFMTDVPFLMGIIISLWLYTRALRLESFPTMFLASIAAAAAILTRQFGLALILGLLLLWITNPRRRRFMPLVAVGIALPSLALLFQLYVGWVAPNWTAQYTALLQSRYFATPVNVALNLLLRPAIGLQYMALFATPFVIAAGIVLVVNLFSSASDQTRRLIVFAGLAISIIAVGLEWMWMGRSDLGDRRVFLLIFGFACLIFFCGSSWLLINRKEIDGIVAQPLSKYDLLLLLGLAIYIVGGILYFHYTQNAPLYMPFLPWNFDIIADYHHIVTVFTTAGAVVIAYYVALRYARRRLWTGVRFSERLLDTSTLALALLQFSFYKMGDEYLMHLVPFVLIVLARTLDNHMSRLRILLAVTCLVMLVASGIWTRGLLERAEAEWQAAESVRTSGVEPSEIYGSWTWNSYQGAFDDYLTIVERHRLANGGDFKKHVYFSRWLPERRKNAVFLITTSSHAPVGEKWEVINEIPYRDILFQKKHVYVVRKLDTAQ